jgi:hypothetical protein
MVEGREMYNKTNKRGIYKLSFAINSVLIVYENVFLESFV